MRRSKLAETTGRDGLQIKVVRVNVDCWDQRNDWDHNDSTTTTTVVVVDYCFLLTHCVVRIVVVVVVVDDYRWLMGMFREKRWMDMFLVVDSKRMVRIRMGLIVVVRRYHTPCRCLLFLLLLLVLR